MPVVRWAYLGAVPTYLVVLQLILSRPSQMRPRDSSASFTVLMVMASVATATGGRLVAALGQPGTPLWPYFRSITSRNPSWDEALSEDPEHRLPLEQRGLLSAISPGYLLCIIEMTCYEAIALFGFTSAYFARSFLVAMPFAVASAALVFSIRPSLGPFLDRPENFSDT